MKTGTSLGGAGEGDWPERGRPRFRRRSASPPPDRTSSSQIRRRVRSPGPSPSPPHPSNSSPSNQTSSTNPSRSTDNPSCGPHCREAGASSDEDEDVEMSHVKGSEYYHAGSNHAAEALGEEHEDGTDVNNEQNDEMMEGQERPSGLRGSGDPDEKRGFRREVVRDALRRSAAKAAAIVAINNVIAAMIPSCSSNAPTTGAHIAGPRPAVPVAGQHDRNQSHNFFSGSMSAAASGAGNARHRFAPPRANTTAGAGEDQPVTDYKQIFASWDSAGHPQVPAAAGSRQRTYVPLEFPGSSNSSASRPTTGNTTGRVDRHRASETSSMSRTAAGTGRCRVPAAGQSRGSASSNRGWSSNIVAGGGINGGVNMLAFMSAYGTPSHLVGDDGRPNRLGSSMPIGRRNAISGPPLDDNGQLMPYGTIETMYLADYDPAVDGPLAPDYYAAHIEPVEAMAPAARARTLQALARGQIPGTWDQDYGNEGIMLDPQLASQSTSHDGNSTDGEDADAQDGSEDEVLVAQSPPPDGHSNRLGPHRDDDDPDEGAAGVAGTQLDSLPELPLHSDGEDSFASLSEDDTASAVNGGDGMDQDSNIGDYRGTQELAALAGSDISSPLSYATSADEEYSAPPSPSINGDRSRSPQSEHSGSASPAMNGHDDNEALGMPVGLEIIDLDAANVPHQVHSAPHDHTDPVPLLSNPIPVRDPNPGRTVFSIYNESGPQERDNLNRWAALRARVLQSQGAKGLNEENHVEDDEQGLEMEPDFNGDPAFIGEMLDPPVLPPPPHDEEEDDQQD